MRKKILLTAVILTITIPLVKPLNTKIEQISESKKKMEMGKTGEWKKITAKELQDNPITLFNDNWMALAAGKEGDMNGMTISWGGIGVLYNKPVITVYVSPNRYTHSFMERYDYFTVTAFTDQYRKALSYIGSHSGRDGDKIKEAGLTVKYTELGNPAFEQGRLIIECRKIYSQQLDESRLDNDCKKMYHNGLEVHSIYIGEIVGVWIKE